MEIGNALPAVVYPNEYNPVLFKISVEKLLKNRNCKLKIVFENGELKSGMDDLIVIMMVTPNDSLMARSPSRESINTELSMYSVSSAASDAKLLKVLASKAGQGPDPSSRGASPNPDSNFQRLDMGNDERCKEILKDCAILCSALGLKRSFSSGDIYSNQKPLIGRNCTSEHGVWGAVAESRALGVHSRTASTWAAAGNSQLPSPQRSVTHHNIAAADRDNKARQSYIKTRLMTTYRALERLSQSEFNLDKLEAAAVAAAAALALPGPTILRVPPMPHYSATACRQDPQSVVLSAADLERDRGRPLTKYERNMMIFNWLHSLDPSASDNPN